MTIRQFVLASLLGAFAVGALAQTQPVYVGTWKINLAKSDYGAATPPRTYTASFKAVENGFSCITDQVTSDGKAVHYEYTVKFDGRDYPVMGYPRYDAISVKKLDDRSWDWSMKKDGVVVSAGTTSYSPDGKVRTLTWSSTDATGKTFEVKAIFDRG